jgi:hypothetical protein
MSVTVELKVPVTPMSNTDQTRIRAGATPWRSQTLQARIAATTLTRKGPERQRLAGPQSNMPLGFLQQGPLTSRLGGGREEDAEGPDDKAKAVLNRCDACSRKGHKAQDCPKRSGKKPAEEPEEDAEAVCKGPEEPEAPVQQRSLPVPHSNLRRFDAADMSDARPSVPKMRTIRLPGTQTLLRRMAIQLEELERSGCVRLDQVWNIPTAEAQQTRQR